MEIKKPRNGFLRGVIWLVVAVVWLLFSRAGTPGAIVCTICMAYNTKRKIDSWRAQQEEHRGGFVAHWDRLEKLSADQITEILVLEELARRENDYTRLVAKATVTRRMILTVIFVAVNFVVMNMMYYSEYAVTMGSALVFVYVRLFLTMNTVKILCAAAKKNPDEPISDLVMRHTFNDVEIPTCKNRVLAGVLAMAVSLGGFFLLNGSERFITEDAQGGCCVTAYMPGIFSPTKVEVPSDVDGKPVVAIGKHAFAFRSGIREIKLNEGIVEIGSGAFKNCSRLKKIELPDSLKTLNGEAFQDCRNLESIEIPSGVTEIRGNTFENCRDLENVALHDNIVYIHAYAFMNCKSLRNIDLPSGITQIHTYTFHGCEALERITIPEGVVRISAHAFSECDSLRQVKLPDTLEEIGSSAFRECDSLRRIEVPADTIINSRAFKDSPTAVYRRR